VYLGESVDGTAALPNWFSPVLRIQQAVLLDDAAARMLFRGPVYSRHATRSILMLPFVNRASSWAVYLENNL